MPVKTDEVKFGHFFSTAKTQYVIPRWQRRYSWTVKEVRELWSDIERVGEAVAKGNPLTHFLGSVVVQGSPVERVVKPSEAHQFAVIDGQQRLATMALFLCALRDSEAGTISDGPDEITNQYLLNSSLKGDFRPRVVLQPDDNDAFRAIVGGFPVPSIDHPVVDAYQELVAMVELGLQDVKYGATVQDRADTLLIVATEYLTAVWMALDPQDNAHRIFQTINAGGKPLEHFDLVRNFFFLRMAADTESADKFFEEFWVPMERRIERAGARPRSYMQSWSNFQGKTGTADRLYNNVVKDLEHKLPQEVVEYGRDFTSSSRQFLPLVSDVPTSSKELNSQLARFRLLQQAPQSLYGLLFTALVYFDRDALSGKQAAEVIEIATSYLVRRQLSGFATQLHNATFRDAVIGFVQCVSSGTCAPSDMPDYVSARLSLGTESRLWPPDDEVKSRGQFADLYTSARRRHLTRVVLGEIDRSLRGFADSGFSLKQYSEMHIEHVMPQSLSAEWLADFGDWGILEPAQTHGVYLNTIGNITLLESEPNSGISNARFADKRSECFATESLVISNALSKEAIWSSDEIRNRAAFLLNEACSIYRGPLSGETLKHQAERFGISDHQQVEDEPEELGLDDET